LSIWDFFTGDFDMPQFPIPAGGADIFYVDESAGDRIFVMATLRVPVIRAAEADRPDGSRTAMLVWPDYHEKAMVWRRALSKEHHIRYRAELHGSDLLAGKGQLHKSHRALNREEAFDLFKGALGSLGFLPSGSIMAAAATESTNLFGQTKMTAALTGLLQRIQRQSEAEKTCGMVFFDEGHDEYFHHFRKAQKYLPVGSALGGWPGGAATKNKPLELFFEDGNPKSSKTSHLMQIVDLAAYAALLKLKFEHGKLSTRRIALNHHTLFDAIPGRVRNLKCQPARGDGIAIIT
jgi:hypothetical protein